MAAVQPDLADRIAAGDGVVFDAAACMSCGICTAACPLGNDLLPRRLMHLAHLGLADRLRAEADTVFSCLLCGACEVQCPAGVKITGTIRAMRRHLNRTLYGIREE